MDSLATESKNSGESIYILDRFFLFVGILFMNKKEAAFSLVELLIVVWILAFVMTAMIQLFIYTSVEAEMAGNKTLAVSEAQNKIEEIIS